MPEEIPEGHIPAARLSEMAALKNTAIAERDTALSRVTALEADLAAHASTIASHAEVLAAHEATVQQHADAAAGWLAKEQGWVETKSIYQAGLTDADGIDVARMFHGKLPESERPAIGEWLESLKADPSTAPRALAPYLGKPAATQEAASTVQTTTVATETKAAEQAAPPAAAPPPAPPVGNQAANGVVTPNGAAGTGAAFSPEAIREATEEMKRGNLGPYKAMREGLLARK